MKNRFFKLPIRFDVPRLVQDLNTCIQQDWSNHFNEKDYSGEWTGISLRSASGNTSDIHSTPNTEGYADTSLLIQCPYFQEIIKQIVCKKEAIRLLALTPGSHIKEHRDLGLAYQFGIFRLHIPITTDELVAFKVDGTNLKMDAGDCWYANFDLPHSVEHHGSLRRIHLVLDCERNDWSDALFQDSGYDFEEEKRSQKPSKTVKEQMIQSLEFMNTDTSRQLIAQLKKEIDEENAQKRSDTEGVDTFNPFSNYHTSAEWLPTHLIHKKGEWLTRWIYLNGQPFNDPFFSDSIAKCKAHPCNLVQSNHLSSLKEMIDVSENLEFIAPTAFIFHVSRCGSTLLTQLLSTDERHIVISEAPLIDDVLNLNKKQPDIPQSDFDAALQAVIKFLGRKRTGLEEQLFIKLDSWHIFMHPIFRRLYPNTPFILLYRSPEEVYYSHQKQRGIQAVPGMIDPTIFGLSEDEMNGINIDFYLGKVLESYFEAFNKIIKIDEKAFLINYTEGSSNMMQHFSEITNCHFDDDMMKKMALRSQYHAKHPHQIFEENIPSKPLPEYLKKAFDYFEKLQKWAYQKMES